MLNMMKIARRLVQEREELKVAIAQANVEYIGKFYRCKNFLDELSFYHLTSVESYKMYRATVVRLGQVIGVTDNDLVSAYTVLEVAEEIDKESFDKAFSRAIELLQK